MCGGAHSDQGPTALRILYDLLHLVVRKIAPPDQQDHQIRLLQRFQAGNIVGHIGADRAIFGIYAEQHRAFKAVPSGQNLRQLRQRLLRTVLLIRRDQNDPFAFAGADAARDGKPGIGFGLPVRVGPPCRSQRQQDKNPYGVDPSPHPFSLSPAILAKDGASSRPPPSSFQDERYGNLPSLFRSTPHSQNPAVQAVQNK